ncbi:MAG: HEAT repeat domain-containing protein [Cyanobacteria bacterium J06554_6]
MTFAAARPAKTSPLLKILNLRPEESQRTLLLLAFYTLMSVGILWLEVSSAALFLERYGAQSLPLIYLFTALVGASLNTVYSWLQRLLPLRFAIVLIAVMMTLPMLLFRVGLGVAAWAPVTIFAMRLWMEAITDLNELNLEVTANQLFNIREIRRTFPLISSGNLLADALSGFTLYFLLELLGIENVLYLVFGIMMLGTGVLYYIGRTHRHAFPDSVRRRAEDTGDTFSARRLQSFIKRYVLLLFGFVILAQVLLYLIEYQYLEQLTGQNFSVDTVAKFLGIFTGVLGLMELLTQVFTSSRLIEKIGIFSVMALLPATIGGVSLLAFFVSLPQLRGARALFLSLIILKFLDEWLRYTLVAAVRPVLFQPIPDRVRARVQSQVGTAEPLSIGLAGALILVVLAAYRFLPLGNEAVLARVFLLITAGLATVWLAVVYWLRSQYLNLLVMTAERGLLSVANANLPVLKQAIIEELDKPGSEEDKRSCIELLTHIEPTSVSEVLAPMLSELSPALLQQSLETMLAYPNPIYTGYVEALISPRQDPITLALALRYVWLTSPAAEVDTLRPYLQPEVDPIVRGTGASMMLKWGDPKERAEATYILRQMLTHEQERERVMGCRALGEADYMQGLRVHVPDLLQDDSLRVRRALLEAIAVTRLEEYYPSLLQALRYKSTREAAVQALVKLGNDALPMLVKLAENPFKPDTLRHQAWQVIGRIGTLEALEILVSNLMTAWGLPRRWILRILLRLADEQSIRRSPDIDTAIDRLGRKGISTLINQELTFIGQLYSSLIDLNHETTASQELAWLQQALRDVQTDAVERMFLLMRFLYPSSAIQAAELSLEGSVTNRARGLEILDNTLDIPTKRSILTVLDVRSDAEKLASLSELVVYRPLSPARRLRNLVDLRHFLSDWSLACCFHTARAQRWGLTPDQVMACLRHPVGFVREAVLSYIETVSPRVLTELLPRLYQDPDPLVAAQVEALMAQRGLGVTAPTVARTASSSGQR